MKFYKTIIFGMGCMAMTLASCDNIADDDRYIPVERPEAEKNVLVLEFTGQLCSNCPDGAAVMTGLMDTYKGHVFTVGVAPQGVYYTQVPAMYDIGLASELGREYYDHYQPDAFPAAIIDGGAINKNYNTWGSAVTEALSGSAPATIGLSTKYDAATRDLTLDYDVTFSDMYNSDLRLLALVVESDIVGYQLTMKGNVLDYVHNHVLRASMNGTWGDNLGGANTEGVKYIPEQVVSGQCTLKLKEGWVAENCAVVCVLLDNSKRFLQAEECHVVNHE